MRGLYIVEFYRFENSKTLIDLVWTVGDTGKSRTKKCSVGSAGKHDTNEDSDIFPSVNISHFNNDNAKKTHLEIVI